MLGVTGLACDVMVTFAQRERELSDGRPSRKTINLTGRAKESDESLTRVWFGLEIPSSIR